MRGALLGLAIPFLTAVSLGAAGCVQQGDSNKFPSGDILSIPSGTIMDHDLYATGRALVIEGTVEGDVVAAAETVQVSGVITGDLWAVAREVSISGAVQGDVRIAAETVTLDGRVGEDVLAAGNNVNIPGAVGGDLVLGARTVKMAGTVHGNVLGGADTYTRTGAVGGAERIHISAPTPMGAPLLEDQLRAAGRRMATLLLLGLVLVLLLPRLVASPAAQLQRGVLRALLWGALSVVGVLAIMIGVLLGGILIAIGLASASFGSLASLTILVMVLGEALLIAAIIVAVVFLAPLAAAGAMGRFLLGRVSSGAAASRILPLIPGVVLLVALESVPYVSGFIRVLLVLLGLGAVVLGILRGSGKPSKSKGDKGEKSHGGDTSPKRARRPVASARH